MILFIVGINYEKIGVCGHCISHIHVRSALFTGTENGGGSRAV